MLGLYKTARNVALPDLDIIDKFTILKKEVDSSSIALVYPAYKNVSQVFFQSNDGWILIDGQVIKDGNEVGAAELFSLLRGGDDTKLERFNGEFFIALFMDKKLAFFNDRMGQRQHCFVQLDFTYSLAPNPGYAVDCSGVKRTINKEALYFFINSKKLRLQRNTILEGCMVLDPGSYYRDINGSLKGECYWPFEFAPEVGEADISKLVNIYKEAVNVRVNNNCKKALTITGGLDSRTMLCAIDEQNRENLLTVTSGMKGCTEVSFAEQVAKRVGVKHSIFDVEPEIVFQFESLNYFKNEDIDLLIQALWKPFLSTFRGSDYLLHGLDLDVTIGGIYLTDKLMELESTEELVEYINSESFINLDEAINLFKPEVFNSYHQVVSKEVESVVMKYQHDSVQQKYDYFIMMQSMNRVILQRYRAIRNDIDTISPMYDSDLIDYYVRTPVEDRKFYKLFYPFMREICGEVAEVKYQRTNLPASVPVHFWADAQKIEKEKEELYRLIAHKTNGESFVHYNGYYTNVDEWMRFNETWKKVVSELLTSENSILRREWIEASYVDRIIDEHMTHKKSHMSTLMRLISAEFFLRLYSGVSIEELVSRFNGLFNE